MHQLDWSADRPITPGDLWRLNRIRDRSGTPPTFVASHIVSQTCSQTISKQLPDRPVFAPVPVEEAARFATEPLPAIGADPDAILDEFARSIGPYPFGNGHPRFWGWVNSPPAVMGIFADAARGRDESERCRRQSRRRSRRAAGDPLVRRDARVALNRHGHPRERRIDGEPDGARRGPTCEGRLRRTRAADCNRATSGSSSTCPKKDMAAFARPWRCSASAQSRCA